MSADAPLAAAPTRSLFGIPVAAVTMDQALDMVDRAVADRLPLQIGVINAAKVVNMRRDPVLHHAVLSCDVIFADGISVVWASWALGQRLPERVAGIDLMTGMLRRGGARRYRVFCLGATGDVLQRTVERIKADFPGIEVVGQHHGYFTTEEEESVAEIVAAAKPDILFVAMTSPKKEQFLARWSEHLNVTVCHGVGGSFDVMAGKVQRAPVRWQQLGLEWLYRVKQEPGRMWKRYLVTNTLFVHLVAVEWAKRRFGRQDRLSSHSSVTRHD